MANIVLIAGFESFNLDLYRQAAAAAIARCPALDIQVFSDREISTDPTAIAHALSEADVFFGSLLFDYDQVLWLRERVERIPIRLVFESALELMSLTQLGDFRIGDQPKGMPKPVKFILEKFSSGREEDKLAGYLSFLKVGPKLLKYVPVQKVQDLRNWLILYGYWNAGGPENVAALFWTLGKTYFNLDPGPIPEPVSIPAMGVLHPDYSGYFEQPRAYLDWYYRQFPARLTWPVVAILLYRKHVVTQQAYIPQMIQGFEQAELIPVPIFINGVEAHMAVRDWLTSTTEQALIQSGQTASSLMGRRIEQTRQAAGVGATLSPDAIAVDAIVSTIGFPLVGGPAGTMEQGRQVDAAKRILSQKNVPYFVAAPLLIQDLASWTRQGIGGLQSVVLYALPELDGAIDTVPLGGLVGNQIYLIPERVARLTGRVRAWINLRRKPIADRKIAILLYGFPPGYGATGTAALLNVPQSLLRVLQALQAEGYDVGSLPSDGEALIQQLRQAEAAATQPRWTEDQAPVLVGSDRLEQWLGPLLSKRMSRQWKSLTGSGINTFGEHYQLGGLQLGNIWIGVQPLLGIAGDPMRLMFERDLTPHPQYAAYYHWLQDDFQADVLIHFGMHGTVEWLPGSPLGNTGYSWPDVLLGDRPNLYIYAANNPSESILAKRRGYGVLISHNVPPYGRAGLYKELMTLKDLISEYREDPRQNEGLRDAIAKSIADMGLAADCPFGEAKRMGIEFTPETARMFSPEVFGDYLQTLYTYLQTLETRLFSAGLHVFGSTPCPEALGQYLEAYFGDGLRPALGHRLPPDVIIAIAEGNPPPRLVTTRSLSEDAETMDALIQEAQEIRDRLLATSDELTNLLRGLNGEYIPPAPGGDLLRDGPGVLPTGRNIHALDPYRMPSPGAFVRGQAMACQLLEQHLADQGEYPETVAVMLWGLDAIKTRGESLGILLELVGAEPIKEGTGRVVRYGLRPLETLGHPRIDVLANLSGIFRDSFAHVLELLDDLFLRAAEADEPLEQNFIRKHAIALEAQGVENPTARLFSNPAGDFGSLVNDRVVDSNWESSEQLGQTWRDRNQFSYGRGDRGQARPEVLQTLLQTTGQIVQQIDSVEYGLTDIQEYYANTGALKQAAEQERGQRVRAHFIESIGADATPRPLNDLLRMEYRTKLLNPKWTEAMVNQGSGGVYEISQRLTALIGWGGTTQFHEAWVYDQAASTYALDPAMAARLNESNPEAFRTIVGRLLEAHGRGFWTPDADVIEKLRACYEANEAQLEGVATV
jgi:magnesium chelatase subunit H